MCICVRLLCSLTHTSFLHVMLPTAAGWGTHLAAIMRNHSTLPAQCLAPNSESARLRSACLGTLVPTKRQKIGISQKGSPERGFLPFFPRFFFCCLCFLSLSDSSFFFLPFLPIFRFTSTGKRGDTVPELNPNPYPLTKTSYLQKNQKQHLHKLTSFVRVSTRSAMSPAPWDLNVLDPHLARQQCHEEFDLPEFYAGCFFINDMIFGPYAQQSGPELDLKEAGRARFYRNLRETFEK